MKPKFFFQSPAMNSPQFVDKRTQGFLILGRRLGSICLMGFFVLGLAAYAIAEGQPSESSDQTVGSIKPDAEGIQFFKGTFEAALVQAKKQRKKVFVDVYTTWCGPCIVMQETVFPLPEVGDFFNKRFVNFKFDAENEDENGPELAATYDINVYPTYLILEPDGSEISRATNAMSGAQFVTLVGRMLGEVSGNFEELLARYEAGERSDQFVQQFLMDAIVESSMDDIPSNDYEAMMAYYEKVDQYKEIAAQYFKSKEYSALANPVDAHLVFYYRDKTPRGDELVEYVLDNYHDFLSVSSDAAMSQFTLSATWYAAITGAEDGNENFSTVIDDLNVAPLKQAVDYERKRDPESRLLPESMKPRLKMVYLETIEDWDAIYQTIVNGMLESNDSTDDAGRFASAARLLSRSDNPEHQAAAVKFGRQGFELNSIDPFIAMDYISALTASDLWDDARTVAEAFRSGLTDSAADQDKLELFDRITVGIFNQSEEEVTSH